MEMILNLPKNYVEFEEDEMTYLDVGVYLNKGACAQELLFILGLVKV